MRSRLARALWGDTDNERVGIQADFLFGRLQESKVIVLEDMGIDKAWHATARLDLRAFSGAEGL